MYILNYNSFTLENDTYHTIDQLDGIARVDVRRSEDFLTGADGGNIWSRKFGMRILSIGGAIFAPDYSTYYSQRALLQTAFNITNTNNLLTITKSDGTQKTIQAKVVDVPDFKETAGEAISAYYQITMKCENPFFTGTSLVTGTTGPTSGGGTPVPMPVPTPVGNLPSYASVTNSGDMSVYPTITLLGPVSYPVIVNQTTGKTFTLGVDVLAGETITMYYDQTGFYVLNGSTNYYQYFTGDFPAVIVGGNLFTLGGTGTNANTLLTISFYEAYLSI